MEVPNMNTFYLTGYIPLACWKHLRSMHLLVAHVWAAVTSYTVSKQTWTRWICVYFYFRNMASTSVYSTKTFSLLALKGNTRKYYKIYSVHFQHVMQRWLLKPYAIIGTLSAGSSNHHYTSFQITSDNFNFADQK